MIFIPGWLIALLTFPGVICHEMAHRFFCDLARVPVYAVSYIRIGNPAGYVVHGGAEDSRSALLISMGPLIVNTVLCSLITFAAMIPIFILQAGHASGVTILLMWVGISIGMHAFPSDTDMANFRDSVRNTSRPASPHRLAVFLSRVFAVANVLRRFWFDAIYAFLVASLLPALLLGLWF